MSAKDPYDRLIEFDKKLGGLFRNKRLGYYLSTSFDENLKEVCQLLSSNGIDRESIKDLTASAARMKLYARRNYSPRESNSVSTHILSYLDDEFKDTLEELLEEVTEIEAQKESQRLLNAIDSSYAVPTQALVSLIPDELGTSRGKLEQAAAAFANGDKEKAVLLTREAWEACVNYALSKLPPVPTLQRHRDKAKYVWSQIGKQDSSGLFVEVKNLFEGAFLHMIEGQPKVKDPEVPFFISITVGFVHLVSETLAKNS